MQCPQQNRTSNEQNRCHPNLNLNFHSSPACVSSHIYSVDNPLSRKVHCVNNNEQLFPDYRALNCCQDHAQQMHQQVGGDNSLFHSCPLGMVVRSNNEEGVTGKAKDNTSAVVGCCDVQVREDSEPIDSENNDRDPPCCERKVSWTEPRIFRCNASDITEASKKCECECGARMKFEKPEKKKSVRFSDELTYIERDKAFKRLEPQDVKECQECVKRDTGACVGRPVLVYELPEPKMEDKSVSQKDFGWHKVPQKEIPSWHPIIKERWNDLNVPSLSETTYQGDFKPQPVSILQRNPVYLTPWKKEKDQCKKLAEDFTIWKKTSIGPDHVYHSNCPKCDEDLHRVHLHECDASNLPVEYRCHGDGHIGDFNTFTLGEAGDVVEGSKQWWKRTCCHSGERNALKSEENAIDVVKPVCYQPATTYQVDYKEPEVIRKYNQESGKCNVCGYFSRSLEDLQAVRTKN